MQGRTSPSVKPSLMAIFHTAAEIPFSVAALSSGFSVPCSGSRICIPYKCPGRPLPASSPAGFSGVSHIRAESRALHCSLERSGAGHLFCTCGTACNAPPSPSAAVPPLLPPSCRRTVPLPPADNVRNRSTDNQNGHGVPRIS